MFRCGSLVELGLCAVWTRPFILVGGRLGEGENIRTASEWRPSSGSPETRSAARKSYLSSFLRRVNLCIYKHFLQPASALRIISASCFALVLNHLTGLKCAVALARPTVFFFLREGTYIWMDGPCCVHIPQPSAVSIGWKAKHHRSTNGLVVFECTRESWTSIAQRFHLSQ